VFVLGEEVANLGGGAYGATKGLPKKYPDRVRNTPISEAGFTGLACGAAMNGMRPIVEIMFSSFALVAADQLFNQVGQLAHIYGGHTEVPVVVRTRIAIGVGYGAQHSLDPVALFHLFPGWRIVAPTTAFDYMGLFNAAMLAKSPTLIVEHQELYNQKFQVPDGPPDHRVRPGVAKVVRAGRDVTVLAYAASVPRACEAAAQLATEGVEAEVIDLRTLDSAGLDYETIGRSLMKTGLLVTVEQAPATNSIGAKIAAECTRRFFDYLDGPPTAVAAPDIPLPVSRRGEQACVPDVRRVAAVIRQSVQRKV
jgi:2-oxoisovalerate dehydrogenase E1 component